MTSPNLDGDPKAPPECKLIERASAELVKGAVQTLNEAGFDFALISVRKAVRGENNLVFAPGAIAHRFNPLMLGVLRREAIDLRRMADELERYADEHGAPDVIGGYVEEDLSSEAKSPDTPKPEA